MDPRDASVYSDTHSPLTWVLILSVIIVCGMTLMVAFIALVHRSIEHSADTPKTPVLEGLAGALPAGPDADGGAALGSTRSAHAA